MLGDEAREVVGLGQGGPGGASPVLGHLGDLVGREPGGDDCRQDVLDGRVGLRADADPPAVVAHEVGDDPGADVGLAGAGRALDRDVGVVHVEQGGRDGPHVAVVAGSRRRAARRRLAGAARDGAGRRCRCAAGGTGCDACTRAASSARAASMFFVRTVPRRHERQREVVDLGLVGRVLEE